MNDIHPVAERLRSGRSFLISSHARIDGDGVGCVLAMSSVLGAMGKPHLVLLSDMIPEAYQFLPGADRAVTAPADSAVKIPEDVDTMVLLDAPEFSRMEQVYQAVPTSVFKIKIDHHQPGNSRADLELVDPRASSTAEILYRVLKEGGLPLTPEAAVNLYVGEITDTGRFTLPNTTAAGMRMCAELIEMGVDAGHVGEMLYRSYPPGVLGLWAEVTQTLRYAAAGQIAVAVLTQEMLARHHVSPADTQDFSDIPRIVRGVKVGLFLRERKVGGFRASLRSSSAPIRAVAQAFGGGGHELAAGFFVDGPLEEAQGRIIGMIEAQIEKHKG